MDAMRRGLLMSSAVAAAAATGSKSLMAQAVTPQTGAEMTRPDLPYEGSKARGPIKIVNLPELEGEAKKLLPPGGFDYISGGSGTNWTRDENLAAYTRVHIEPQALSGVTDVDLRTRVLGSDLAFPVIIPPMGSHGLAHVDKEAGTAAAAHAVGALMVTSMQSNLSLEEIAAVNPGPKWMQLYVPADRGYLRELLQRAKAAGYTAFTPTIDNVYAYPREENIRNAFRPPTSLGKGNMSLIIKNPEEATRAFDGRKRDLNFDDMEFIKKESGLAVIPKGVMSVKVADEAMRRGLDAVYVSNHGGRAFDGVQATLTTLPRIVDAVAGRAPIIFDGGVRRGTDVFRALALGANVVACGRPVLYGLALGGREGAQSVLEYLRDNLILTMRLAGAKNLKAISADYLAPMMKA